MNNYYIRKAEPLTLSLDSLAFHGLAGDFIRAIEPHSEADPAALLISFLVAYGNIVGRNAWFTVDGATHYPNLFVVLVGSSSTSRKGTTQSRVTEILRLVEAEWTNNNCVGGLSSGEGLIHAVRDAADIGDGGYDSGVRDKRLLVFEPEFGQVFRQFKRQGNILSATVRQAWDDGNLSVLTKSSPEKATDAHISIVAHITPEELHRSMSDTEVANGFGNRFIWLMVKKSKNLPLGGKPNQSALESLATSLQASLAFTNNAGEVEFDDDARGLWVSRYPELNMDRPGIAGALLSRGPAQVRRLALIYALLDCSQTVGCEHLDAALALWAHASCSVRAIFGDSLGHQLADEILDALRRDPSGMDRTAISELFKHNKSSREIDEALGFLRGHDLATCHWVKTRGRSSEVWRAAVPNAGPTSATSDSSNSYISYLHGGESAQERPDAATN